MPFLRDSVPSVNDQRALRAYLERTLEQLEEWVAFQERWDTVAADLFSVAAYAQVTCDDVTDGNIGTGWQPMDFFEVESFAPRGITLGLNGQITFPYEGIYRLHLSGTVTHNEFNGGRQFTVRPYNITQAAAGVGQVIPTGRNSPGSPVSVATLFEVQAADVGDSYRFEYGGTTDTYTSVEWETLSLGVNMVSEFRGEIAGGAAGS